MFPSQVQVQRADCPFRAIRCTEISVTSALSLLLPFLAFPWASPVPVQQAPSRRLHAHRTTRSLPLLYAEVRPETRSNISITISLESATKYLTVCQYEYRFSVQLWNCTTLDDFIEFNLMLSKETLKYFHYTIVLLIILLARAPNSRMYRGQYEVDMVKLKQF